LLGLKKTLGELPNGEPVRSRVVPTSVTEAFSKRLFAVALALEVRLFVWLNDDKAVVPEEHLD